MDITRGDVGITLGFGIFGLSNERMFPRNVNVCSGADGAGAGVGAGVGAVVAGVVGVVVGAGGVVVGGVGIVGMVVGIVGMMVGIVGIEVMTGDGFIGADMPGIDRRARPSSCSTEIDALLLVRRPAARRSFCSWCGFIGFFS